MNEIIYRAAYTVAKAVLLGLIGAAVFVTAAQAAPTLTADPYPSSGPQPTSVSITVNGQPGPACTLPRAANGSVTPTCDLASLASPGTYTIVMSVSASASCPNPSSPATCQGGSASSTPFQLTLQGPPARPTLRVGP